MSTGQINFKAGLSSDKFRIVTRSGNAAVTGLDYGWFKIEHDSNLAQIRVRMYANQNDAAGDYVAGSAEVDVSSLPATVTLTARNGSGCSATIYIDGVR